MRKMKKSLILIILLLSFKLVLAQSNAQVLIESEFELIQTNLGTYKKVISETNLKSTEGNEIIAFYSCDKLKLIRTTGFGETGKIITDFYFKNEKLIFVLDQRFEYNRPIYWDEKIAKENSDNEIYDPNKTKINTDKYYFEKEILFLWLDNDKNKIDLTLGTNTLIGKGLIAHMNKLRSELK